MACRQIGPIRIKGELEDGEEAFSERRSLLFKRLQVARFFDRKRNVLVYLVYSDKLIEGGPKNAISPSRSCPGRTRAERAGCAIFACALPVGADTHRFEGDLARAKASAARRLVALSTAVLRPPERSQGRPDALTGRTPWLPEL